MSNPVLAHSRRTALMTRIALMTALICVFAPIAVAIPISPVPISLGTLMMFLAGVILGPLEGVLSCGLYLALGFLGLPVFANWKGGIQQLVGPTGGYMVGYFFCVLIPGLSMKYLKNRALFNGLAMVLGLILCYSLGTFWLAHLNHISFVAALSAAVVPYLLGDGIKILLAAVAGTMVRQRLERAGLVGNRRFGPADKA